MSGTQVRAAVLGVLAVVSLGLVIGLVLTHRASDERVRPAAVTGTGSASRAPTGAITDAAGALEVLHRWDAARSRAWATGDVEALRSLYVEGSGAGVADVRLLRRYLARGLVVHQLRSQTLAVHALDVGPQTLRLRVTERLARAVASTGDGAQTLPRPRDPTTRVVELRRGIDNRWRVASVA